MALHSPVTSTRLVLSMMLEGDGVLDAELRCIDEAGQVYVLSVGGIPQSRVSLADPARLEFEYVRQIGRVIDVWADLRAAAGHPLAVTHLGAGALTLARYVAHTTPGSAQCVVEREQLLCEAVTAALPLAEPVDFVFGDARAIAESQGWQPADVTVVDLWSGASIASRVASLEFYRLVALRMKPGGVVTLNLLDGPGFRYLKGQVAAVREAFSGVAVVLDERMLSNTVIGNALVLASDTAGAFDDASRWFAHEERSHLTTPVILTGEALAAWVGATSPATDADGCDSPPPDESHFDEFRGSPFFA